MGRAGEGSHGCSGERLWLGVAGKGCSAQVFAQSPMEDGTTWNRGVQAELPASSGPWVGGQGDQTAGTSNGRDLWGLLSGAKV